MLAQTQTRPTNAAEAAFLRDDLANPATGVILLYRPAMQGADGSKSDTRVIFDKSRNGETGMVRFTFDGPTQAFEPVRGGGWQR